MLRRSHVDPYPGVQGQTEQTGLGRHGLLAEATKGRPGLLGKHTVVDVSVGAVGVGEQGKVAETRGSSCSAVVHRAEAGHGRPIQGKASLVAGAAGICASLCHAVWEGGTGKYIASVAGPDQGVDIFESVDVVELLGDGLGNEAQPADGKKGRHLGFSRDKQDCGGDGERKPVTVLARYPRMRFLSVQAKNPVFFSWPQSIL